MNFYITTTVRKSTILCKKVHSHLFLHLVEAQVIYRKLNAHTFFLFRLIDTSANADTAKIKRKEKRCLLLKLQLLKRSRSICVCNHFVGGYRTFLIAIVVYLSIFSQRGIAYFCSFSNDRHLIVAVYI